MIKLTLLLAFVGLLGANQYDFNCAKPMKIAKPTGNHEIRKYNEANRSYKSCVDTFIRENTAKRNRYNDAVNYAIQEWNEYANATQPKKDKSQKFEGSQGVPKGGSHTVGHSDPYNISTSFKF